MKTINVTVRDKIASAAGDIVYICGNSDYVINFDFDAEWDDYDVKTARFVHDGSYIDIVFTGNQCAMPVIHKAYGIYVGVYASDLRTTTPAHIPSAASILSAEGTPAAPPDDVYAQITALCNEAVSEAKRVRDDADAGKFNGAPGKTPVPGADYFTDADKQAIAAEAAQEVGFPQPTSEDNGKYLGCENGAAKWMPVEASGGGSEQTSEWEIINSIEITEEGITAVTFDRDANGNEFDLTDALLVSNNHASLGGASSTSLRSNFIVNDKKFKNSCGNLSGASRRFSAIISSINGTLYMATTDFNSNTGIPANIALYPFVTNAVEPIELSNDQTVKSIKLNLFSPGESYFAVGYILSLYGRRKK